VFERFTERARQVVVLAQDDARMVGHAYIGTEHLLLGLLREEEGIAARALRSLGVELGDARAGVLAIVGSSDARETGQIPFTPRAKRTLEAALEEAVALGHGFVGTEHVLLGLLRIDESVALEVLTKLGAARDDVRAAVLAELGGESEPVAARPKARYVVLRQVDASRWELVGEVERRPGLPARKSRAQAVQDATGGKAVEGEAYAVLPRSEWQCALDC
jgi:ATP-dependent Clp protease ATP-binding subunit ClpA